MDATGIGATACARHGCFVPHTVVDFQLGERLVMVKFTCCFTFMTIERCRQLNMDYSIAHACARLHPSTEEVVFFYDVICQWFVNFKARVRRSPPLNRCFAQLQHLKYLCGIGLFHVHGHQATCFPRYSPDFIHGVGQVDGEVVETLWSQLNDVSRSCRGILPFLFLIWQ